MTAKRPIVSVPTTIATAGSPGMKELNPVRYGILANGSDANTTAGATGQGTTH